MPPSPRLRARLAGLLVGTAVGDALGLPTEGLSPRRARRLFPPPWRHRLVAGRGLVSDDTEHTVFVCQALLASPRSPDGFARRLAFALRWWLLALPAGVGLATLRAILRLWLGFAPEASGVWSAGNGPAMRAAPIGAVHATSPAALEAYVRASTVLTHRDPRALTGALAVARVAAWCVLREEGETPSAEWLGELLAGCAADDSEWQAVVAAVVAAADERRPVERLAADLGLADGVTGYTYHTVPVALYGWWRHFGDVRASLEAVLDCGGDTDSTGAIVGALAGAAAGLEAIPAEWRAGVSDWPRGLPLLDRLAERLVALVETGQAAGPVRYPVAAVVPRNLLFLAVVLAHGLRRLAPPY